MNDICPCVGELIAAAVAAEALEHNAVQSRMWTQLGNDLRRDAPNLIEQYEYEYPISGAIHEPLAIIGLAAWLSKIEEKCGIKTSDLMEKNGKARELMIKNKPWEAQKFYLEIKSALLDRATEFCSG